MIKIGQIGAGYWGPNVANSFTGTGRSEVTWICDLNAESRAAFQKMHPAIKTTDNLSDVIDDPDIDAVAVVTPTNTHFDIAKAALEAGKHVLVEKPITTIIDQAEELVALADRKNLILMVGHVFQYNASILALKALIDDGELGDINYLNFVRTNLGPVRTDVNALWDLVSHDAYIMANLLGAEPVAVSALGQAYLNETVEDVIFATFTFASGAMAHVHASWLNPRKTRQITAIGSKKMVLWDDLNIKDPIHIFDKRVEPPAIENLEGTFLEYKTMVVDGGSTAPKIQLNQPLQSECEHFLDCLESGDRPRSDGNSGLAVVRALKAAEKSMQNGGVLTEIA